MSQPSESPLQFDQAEFGGEAAGPAGATCGLCGAVLQSEYFRAGSLISCGACRTNLEAQLNRRASLVTLLRALAWGSGASLLGAGLYYGVTKITGYEIGLVSMAVGILVGRAVHKGNGGLGGRAFQLMAVALAYLAMAGSYVPFVVEGIIDQSQKDAAAMGTATAEASAESEMAAQSETAAESGTTAESAAPAGSEVREAAPAPQAPVAPEGGELGLGGALLMLLFLFISLPIQVGMESPLSGLIMAFALWEGWRVNTRVVIPIEGPFELKPEAAAESRPEESPGAAAGE